MAATALPGGSAATVAIVCDGVSSASRPDEASAAAAVAANEALLEALPRGAHPQEAMHEAILAAADAVNALAPETPGAQNAPACTLVGAVVSGGLLTIGWVGDSRAYWIPDDRAALPRRLTEDDSWAAQMVAAGLMGEAEAYADVRAHAITGWLGADAYDLEPHTATFKPDHPGVVVVCTDGLWNYAESARRWPRWYPPMPRPARCTARRYWWGTPSTAVATTTSPWRSCRSPRNPSRNRDRMRSRARRQDRNRKWKRARRSDPPARAP